jgi:S-DNA-T family DNA segregation ATPase FtsK/SpoIIIE
MTTTLPAPPGRDVVTAATSVAAEPSGTGSLEVGWHRPPRVFPDPLTADPVTIAAPPAPMATGSSGGLLAGVGALGALGVVVFAATAGSSRFLVAAVAVAVLMAAASVAVYLSQRRAAARRWHTAVARYRAYLAAVGQQLQAVAAAQRARAARLHPDPAGLLEVAVRRSCLWERRPTDPDFLEVRLGTGDVPLAATLTLQAVDPLADHDPGLLAEAAALLDRWGRPTGAPVTVPLAAAGPLAISGDLTAGRSLARALLCQLTVWQAPGDLHLVAFVDPAQAAQWEWLKWLPHTRRGADAPWTATVATSVADLEVLLARLVAPRLALLDRDGPAHPLTGSHGLERVVVVLDGYRPTGPVGRLPLVAELLDRGPAAGVLTLLVAADEGQLPAQVGALARIDGAGRLDYLEAAPGGRRHRGLQADAAPVEVAEAIARAMAPLAAPQPDQARAASVDSPGLLDLVAADGTPVDGDGWAPRPAAALLRSPIGTDAAGAPVQLDLKEAAEGGMGPHGFVIGATGSGKSELLRTLVGGLAVGHPPEELAFVLVDFKGGATFAEVAQLPHVAGLITNLERDLTLVDRMREALFGELERRQRLLADHGVDSARGYQTRRAARPDAALPPLPSLVVIVDEFGELLDARPDFLDLFVSIGRVGRSLGVHLLLASQRLQEGRIRGLEGHLRYRICLRTFSPEESLAALGSRAAFELPPLPGLGYLQVDGTTRRFQAALATRPRRAAAAPVGPTSVLRAFDLTSGGAVLATLGPGPGIPPAPPEPPAPQAQAGTDLAVAVEVAGAAGRRRRVRQVWLPPPPTAVPLDAVLPEHITQAAPGSAGWLRIPLGLLDLPREQAQVPLQVDLAGADGHLAVVGAPRTGKSTLLQTLIAALALTHDPADVQVYAVDLGGGGLHALAGLPHVGAVCGRGEPDRIRRIVRELRAVLDERAAAFRAGGVADMGAWHAARRAGRPGGTRHGEVLCVVDNWAALATEQPELADELTRIATGGLAYGIHLAVASGRWADFRAALRDSLSGRLELRLGDPVESLLDRHAARALPRHTPGRGLATTGEQFHAALPRVDAVADASGLRVGLEDLRGTVSRRWRDAPAAPPIRMLPLTVRPADLPDPASDPGPGIAVGLEEFRLAPARLDLFGADPHLLVVGDGECGKSTMLRCLLHRLTARYGPDQLRVGVVDYRRQLAATLAGLPHVVGYATTPNAAGALAATVAAEASGRLPADVPSAEDVAALASSSGPRLLVVVDDYDLVASATGNPLAALVGLLAHGRDVGLHVVITRRTGGFSRAAFEPLLQRLRELDTPGLLMRGDPGEGPLLGGVKADATLPAGRTVLVRRRGSLLVQLAHVDDRGR